jgi:hypothetical protein
VIAENDIWQALRIGLVGDLMLTDRVKVSGEAAYLPYVNFDGIDHHFSGNTGVLASIFPKSSNGGRGVQLEALLSYDITPQFSVGLGGRYWAMWTTNGVYYNCTFNTPMVACTTTFPSKQAVEQAGVFLQATYKFGSINNKISTRY